MNFKNLILVFTNTIIIIIMILILDYFFGKAFVANEERFYRIKNNDYHHTLKSGYQTNRAYWWGAQFYNLVTDLNGFKYHSNKRDLKSFDIGFIGDSFTEGVGYQYSDTFVGKIDDELKNKSVANLAVSSYSPKIYLSKLSFYIQNGYYFKELFVVIDSSDVLDDYFRYEYIDGKVIDKNTSLKLAPLLTLLNKLTKIFPLTYNLYNKITSPNNNDEIYEPNKAQYYNWTKKDFINNKITNEELYKAIDETKSIMDKLYVLLKKNNINLSIIVYPSTFDLKQNNFNSLNRIIWKEFCKGKCNYFIDFFPTIFKSLLDEGYEKTHSKYYIDGDNHFNHFGHETIKNEFIKIYKK